MGLLSSFFGRKNNNASEQETPIFQKHGYAYAERTRVSKEVLEGLKGRYIAFDVETTGLSAYTDRIVEVGAVVFEKGVIVNRYSSLVNPGIQISDAASRVNHITNDMLKSAPQEDTVYPELINFLGDSLQGNTLICAHNAKFDMDFLCEAFRRLGYDANIRYVDTLSLSRSNLKLDDYKQNTVAIHYGIENENAHRAVSDAEVCGRILWELLKIQEKAIEEQEKKLERKQEERKLSEEEKEVCAVIQDAISKRGGDSQWIRFYRNSGGYVDIRNFYTFLKFKIASKGKYIIIPNDIEIPVELPIEKCSMSEGGTDNKRVYFNSPFSITFLGDYFFSAYENAEESRRYYFRGNIDKETEIVQYKMDTTGISDEDAMGLLQRAENKEYCELPVRIDSVKNISREDVIVNAVHNRCPLSEINNYGDLQKGFDVGFPFYESAEKLRKNGDIEASIVLYDKARSEGYDAPALYMSYAKAFRKLKDYDNEIAIVDEYFERNPEGQYGELEARRDKAVELLYNLQQTERALAEKAELKEQKKREKEAAKAAKAALPKELAGKSVLQMDDDGNIIKEYESVSLASREAGISPKSIRDAAKGVQKHAGGSVWRYKDSLE